MSKKFSYFILGVAVTALFVFTLKNCNISISNKDNKLNDSTISNAQITKENIEYENVELPEKKQPMKENNEILATEFSSYNDFPIDLSLYLESGYITKFTKYNKDGKTYVFHEFSTGGDGKQGLENNKQGLYCVDTKQWVLADITYDYYTATWDVYCIDDGKFYNYFQNGMDGSTDGFTYFPNCGDKIAEAVRSLGLTPIETAKDKGENIKNINDAFNLIGYTPE